MFAQGTLPIETAVEATGVPSVAAILVDHASFVFTVDNKKAKRVPVVRGIQVGEEQQISGLPNGTLVVVKGQASLAEGTPVAVDEHDVGTKAADSVMK